MRLEKWQGPRMGVGSGEQGGPWPPWIFIHGTNIVDRALKCYFLAFFAIFRCFFVGPPLKEAK